jgi:hypothetical protein
MAKPIDSESGKTASSSALEQLFKLISEPLAAQKNAVEPNTLRYVLYARKSTTDEGRQEKSVPGQIADCTDRVIKPAKLIFDPKTLLKSAAQLRSQTYVLCSGKCLMIFRTASHKRRGLFKNQQSTKLPI